MSSKGGVGGASRTPDGSGGCYVPTELAGGGTGCKLGHLEPFLFLRTPPALSLPASSCPLRRIEDSREPTVDSKKFRSQRFLGVDSRTVLHTAEAGPRAGPRGRPRFHGGGFPPAPRW